MYIIAIGWLWVVFMMALVETSVTAAVLTFFFYGLAPLALFLWLFGTPARRRRSADQAIDEQMGEMDRGDTRGDQ